MPLPFLTSYDPLGVSSGSIDPLGALQSYTSLADLILPGVTTITTRSRYLSMMCAALHNAEEPGAIPPGPAGLAHRRKVIEPFERLWALACVAARDAGVTRAADGLRGVTYAQATLREIFKGDGQASTDYFLLKYQGRTGAVGTYWTSLVGGALIDRDSGGLASEGHDLARAFPPVPLTKNDKQRLADPERARRVKLSPAKLCEWGRECHLAGARSDERRLLADALIADDRRSLVSEALRALSRTSEIPETWDLLALKQLKEALPGDERVERLALPVTLDAVIHLEQFHESVLRAFETLLWWGTEHSDQPVSDLLQDTLFIELLGRCQASASRLRVFRDHCQVKDVRDAIENVVRFAQDIERRDSLDDVVAELLCRHHRVQSGKAAGGAPKRDWVAWDGAGSKLLRPSARFQRPERPPGADGNSLTHPYRLEPFVHMLRENRFLPPAKPTLSSVKE